MSALPCWCADVPGLAEHPEGEPCPTRDYWLDVEDSELGDD